MAGGRPFHGFDFLSHNGNWDAPSLRLRSGQALAFFARAGTTLPILQPLRTFYRTCIPVPALCFAKNGAPDILHME